MKFEYRVIYHQSNGDFQEEINMMNYMGDKGWEIIKVDDPKPYTESEGEYVRIFYKRIKTD